MTNRDKTAAADKAEGRTDELVAAAVAGAREDNPSASHGAVLLTAAIRLRRAALRLNGQLQAAGKHCDELFAKGDIGGSGFEEF